MLTLFPSYCDTLTHVGRVFWHQVKCGGLVPRSYYGRESIKVQYEHRVSIQRGCCYQLEYEILFPGCMLR